MTCRRLGMDAQRYLNDILRKVNTYPCNRLAELLPDVWKQRKEAAGEIVHTHRDDFAHHRRSRPTIERV